MPDSNTPLALVTGATRGIGREVAVQLARDGHDVILVGRDRKALSSTAGKIADVGGHASPLPLDLLNRDSVERMVTAVKDKGSALNVLVLNAASADITPLDSPDTRDFDRLMELNLVSPLRTVRELLPLMVDQGRIVAIASVLARFGVPGLHGYCASKAGLVGAVRALALELAPKAITVNAVCPTWVETEMALANIRQQAPSMGMSPEEARAFFEADVPLNRFLKPKEVASLVGYLASPEAAGMTGQALNLCAGTMA